MATSYASMLADLMNRRDSLTIELKGVIAAIAAISPLVGGESTEPPQRVMPQAQSAATGAVSQSMPNRYARVSVRWAALWHLAEFANGPMRNGQIAEAILRGGYRSGAGSFPNAASAVLSGMREKGEIDGDAETGYFVTDKGKQTWALIKQGAKFREATSSNASTEQPLLSVQ